MLFHHALVVMTLLDNKYLKLGIAKSLKKGILNRCFISYLYVNVRHKEMCLVPYIRTNMLVNREQLCYHDQAAFLFFS